MKISFVIPAYNEESYIGECLKSLTSQALNSPVDVEIIVVDNASTDKTAEVAKSFPGVIIVHEPKKGLTNARQAGFKASHGDIIANIDADTKIGKGWIETVVSEFTRNPKLVGLSGPFTYYDLPRRHNSLVTSYYYLGYGIYVLNRFVLRVGSMIQGGNFVIRRAALEEIGGFNLMLSFWGEDADIAKRLHKVGPVKFTFRLKMPSSGRRLAEEGIIRMGLKYPLNYFSTIFLKGPISTKYKDIRK